MSLPFFIARSISLCLLALCLAATASAVVFGMAGPNRRLADPRIGDMRRLVSTSAAQMDAIGMVESGPADGRLDARGTAFLVDRCHALTNQHVIFGQRAAGSAGGRRISFFVGSPDRCRNPHRELPGSGLRDSFCHSYVGEVENDGDPAALTADNQTPINREDDWAIIRLEAPVDASIEPIGLSDTDFRQAAREGAPALSAGYPGDKLNPADIAKLWGQTDCRLLPLKLFEDARHHRQVQMIATTCPATAGNSGSPLLIWAQDHKSVEAIGLIASGPNEKTIGAFGQKLGRHDVLLPLSFADRYPNVAVPVSGPRLAEALRQARQEGCPR